MAAAAWRSSRHPAPVIELSLFRDRLFTASNLSALLVAGSFGVFFLSTILWLEGHWHYSAFQTGFAIAPIPVIFAPFAAIAESLQVIRGIRPVLIVGGGPVIVAGGILLLAVMLGEHRSAGRSGRLVSGRYTVRADPSATGTWSRSRLSEP